MGSQTEHSKTSLNDVFAFPCHAGHVGKALALGSGVLLFKHLLNIVCLSLHARQTQVIRQFGS